MTISAFGKGLAPRAADVLKSMRRWSLPLWISFLRAIPSYSIVALLTVGSLVLIFGLWGVDLSYPLGAFSGDQLLATYVAKALGQNALLHNEQVGYPFGLDFHDFWQPDFTHHWMLSLLVKATGDPLFAVNSFYLLSFVLIVLSAFYVFRQFQISSEIAAACALLYAYTPSHIMRSSHHLFLSAYYLVPLAVFLALRIMWSPPTTRKSESESTDIRQPGNPDASELDPFLWTTPLPYLAILLSFLIGGAGVYYAFYSILFLGAASVYAWWRHARGPQAVLGICCTLVIAATTVGSLVPTIAYQKEFGQNPAVAQRSVGQSEILSLKIAHLILPMSQHRIKSWQNLTNIYLNNFPPLHANESHLSSLGTVAAIGFLVLIACSIWGRRGVEPTLLGQLSVLNLVGVLFATTAGFAALFALTVTPLLRAGNRISFFIAFFSLFAIGNLLETWRRRLLQRGIPRIYLLAAVGVVLIAGIYDQTPMGLEVDYRALRGEYEGEQKFITQVEALLPVGASVLQLPFEVFPEGEPIHRMGGYDHLRPYLLSKTLRWSYPLMRGRAGEDWMRELSSKAPPDLLLAAVGAGFQGIFIDRNGYVDAALELESRLNAESRATQVVSVNQRYSFLLLRDYATKLLSPTTAVNAGASHVVLGAPRVAFTYPSGVHALESDKGREWRWCQQSGTIGVVNFSDTMQRIILKMVVIPGRPERATVYFRSASGMTREVVTEPNGTSVSFDITAKPGHSKIDFYTTAKRVETAPTDDRQIYFRIEHPQIFEVPR